MTRDIIWQAGQRFVAGFEGLTIPDNLRNLVREHKVGNIILFKRNIESAQQLHDLCRDLQQLVLEETGLPAFITIDQEGGAVSRLPSDTTAVVPSAMAVAATGDPDSAYQAGFITGCELSAMGCNFNLAPVMDVNSNIANPVIGSRSYSDDCATVARYGSAMIRGLENGGVLSCAKHFPGHGDTDVDSHLGLPRVEKTLEELEACELVPFRAAIDAGVSAIMTTHILFPNIEKENVPATMSKTILQDVLRGKMGYDGLIISDCMMMQAIASFYGTVPGALAAADAGVDLICICHSPELTAQACEALAAQADPAKMEKSVSRIVAAKQAMAKRTVHLMSAVNCEEHRKAVRAMREASLSMVGAQTVPSLGEKPFFAGCAPFQATLVGNPEQDLSAFPIWMQNKMGGTAFVTDNNPSDAEIVQAAEAAKDATGIAVCTYNGHMKPGQRKLMETLAGLGKPTICCALRDPYDLMDLPENVCGLCVYEYSRDSLEILLDAFTGKLTPQGKLSVKL